MSNAYYKINVTKRITKCLTGQTLFHCFQTQRFTEGARPVKLVSVEQFYLGSFFLSDQDDAKLTENGVFRELKQQIVPSRCWRILLLYWLFRNQLAANAQTSLRHKHILITLASSTYIQCLHSSTHEMFTQQISSKSRVHLIVSFLREQLTWRKYTRNATKKTKKWLLVMFKFCQKR